MFVNTTFWSLSSWVRQGSSDFVKVSTHSRAVDLLLQYLLNTVSKFPFGFAFSISSGNAVKLTRLWMHSIRCVEACCERFVRYKIRQDRKFRRFKLTWASSKAASLPETLMHLSLKSFAASSTFGMSKLSSSGGSVTPSGSRLFISFIVISVVLIAANAEESGKLVLCHY